VTAPTRLLGVADPYALTSQEYYDALEHVPDLQPGPYAIQAYAKMRRDSRLAAVIAGYTLQIRRASWQVEPGDCRPEVVQLVADDLGLPIAGKDIPGVARTKGVSWNDHLRAALLSLVYGHMAFELLAEVREGQARLTTLARRFPSTIEAIHQDPKTGALLGITQDKPRRNDAPQISADRLAFYTHDREASWYGTSLLRPSYGPWYLKQELMRIHATSARRFGMGVPTVEWAASTNPTPAQIREAQQVASAARVGEQAGASLPPGASLVLRGLSGGTPDVLAYIKFLNSEMAGAALMPHIDLGNTESGSRAVASTFLDSWTLALGAIGEEIADTTTRQVAARLVEWNFADEPVPRVVVAGVGTQREVTAESLNQLLQSGALSADPGLEAWIRREYRLPERDEVDGRSTPSGRVFEHDLNSGVLTRNERRAQIGLPPIAGGDTLADPKVPQSTPVAAKATRARKQPEGQLVLPIAASAEDDAERVQAEWAAAVAAALAAWPGLSGPMVAELVALAAAAVGSGDVGGLAGLTVSAAVVEALVADLAARMTVLAESAAGQVVVEAAAQGVAVEPVVPDEGRLSQVAAVTASLLAAGYASAAARRAMNTPAEAVAGVVRAALDDMSTAERGMVADHLSAAMSTAQGAGRLAVLEANPPTLLRASEHLDQAACDQCKAVDRTEYSTLAAALADYPNCLQFRGCAGMSRCRGMLIPVWS
jgi:hypothetical protein